jgi:glycosyltransferase involved in cell wall biosynthesis
MPPLSIAMVNQHRQDVLGGSEIQCDIIASGLSQRGHRVEYVAVAGTPGHDYGTRYAVHPVERSAKAIAAAVVALKPDIVYWRFNKHCFAQAVRIIRGAGIPVVFSVSHLRDVSRFYFEPAAWRNGGIRQMRRALKESWQLFREHRGFAQVDALVTLNADFLGRVPVPLQVHIPNSMVSTTEPFNWPRPYCLWVANIKDRKQPEKFVDLARSLLDTGVDFLMVGRLQSKAYSNLLASGPASFHFLGEKRVEEVNGMLANSLFLVHTCLPEGFGNIFIQAWLQGKTAVSLAFDPGGLLESESLGFYSRGSMASFVAQARDLIERPELAAERGRRAQAYAENHFSPDKNVAQLETLILQVLCSTSPQ